MEKTILSIVTVVMAICMVACDKEDWDIESADTGLVTLNNGRSYVDLGLSVKWSTVYSNWGGPWRMPTANEIQELLDKCTWKYAKYPGSDIYGYKVTSEVEGFTRNYIFLPVTGYKDGTDLRSTDSGFYWSANSNKAYPKSLYFNSRKNECQDTYPYYGYAVRAVCK